MISERREYFSVLDELLRGEQAVLHDGGEHLVGDVGHLGVGGGLPDQFQQHIVPTLGRQHAAVSLTEHYTWTPDEDDGHIPRGVLCTDVMDGPDCPELDSLFLFRNQQREEGFEGSIKISHN